MARAEGLELSPYVIGDVVHVRRRLFGHPSHLEAAAQVHDGDIGELCGQVEGHARDALPDIRVRPGSDVGDRKSTRLNSSHGYISYAVFCLKKKKTRNSRPYLEARLCRD